MNKYLKLITSLFTLVKFSFLIPSLFLVDKRENENEYISLKN